MGFLQFSGQDLFDGNQFLGPNQVLITNEEGQVEAILPRSEAGEEILEVPGILSPGFVNAHCHLELSHMKGRIPEHTGLPEFILKIVNERHHPEEEIREAIAQAEAQMMQEGIVAVGDISNNHLTAAQKAKQNLAYYTFVEISGWKPEIAEPRFSNAQKVMEQFRGIITAASFSPHAPYSVSRELWEMMMPHFEGNTVTIHNQETPAENELFQKGSGDFVQMYQAMNIDQAHFTPTGKNSLPSYFPQLQKAKNVLLVHNTNTSEADMDFATATAKANQQSLYYALCVNANLYIENALPPIELLRSKNANIVLGTDSLSSNHQLSILEEVKTIARNFPSIPLAEMLQWATNNGAKALQMDAALGSIAPGKKPGIIVLENVEPGKNLNQATVRRLI
ncbi:amidohydrolase family protein [Sediminibacterium sp. TEGAF015]|uniref:amidohydrolase family protein n=1 Tax=Sediminibacterium sp. TEGAF015 TaxID=575378 RepID=UPI00220AD6DA|nr:amidohydrolase family protein [Sediminibacterium sp. TEGAF015]BDQ12632.1 chlorohydrolase [Sediminibacterium sp. TEGAF015]